MSETLHQRQDFVVPSDIMADIEARVHTQPGGITPQELEEAAAAGWRYGLTLVNGFKPEENVLQQMAYPICGIGARELINTNHYIPVITALDVAARAAKRTLAAHRADEATGPSAVLDV
jgi:hypothetical protein